jgi:hypothetical protein
MKGNVMSRLVGFLLVLVAADVGAHPLDVWHWRNPLPQGNSLNAIAYGNGLYVAVGAAGTVLTSADATNWTRRISGTFEQLNSITFGNNQFVAVGAFGAIVTSADGILWAPQYGGTFFSLNGVTFGNGMYVVVGENNTIITSIDGIMWVSRSSGRFFLSDVAYGNNRFVAVGSAVLTSSDGLNWFRQPLDLALGTIAFANGIFVGGAGSPVASGGIWISVNGADWQLRQSFEGEVRGITYGAGKWAVVGTMEAYSVGVIYVSSNAINWNLTHTNSNPINGATFGAGRFVATLENGTVLLSENAVTWANPLPEPLSELYGWQDVAYSENGFAVVGPYVVVARSSDGVVWTNCIAPTNVEEYLEFHSIAYGNGLYVAGGDYRTLWVSADGNNWTNPVPELNLRPYVAGVKDIIYANGGFIAVSGYQGSVLTSPDGIQWSVQDLSLEETWYLEAVAFGNGIYVVVGHDRVAASSDATNWHITDVGWEVNARSIAHGNGRFVVVGDGYVIVSTDGTNWVRTAYITYLQQVAFGAGHFLAVGGDYDFGLSRVWSSEDGVNWTPRYVFTEEALMAVGYGNGSFVIAGRHGGILQSDPLVALNLTMGTLPNITLTGPVNRTYELECASESGVWSPLKTVFADSMPFTVPDPTATNALRLYRALLK